MPVAAEVPPTLSPAANAQAPALPHALKEEAVNEAKAYCDSVANSASDTRLQWQMRAIFAAKEEMDAKLKALEEKTAELQHWVKKRDEILRRAEGHVVQIYANMRADAAAEQLSTLDDKTAVSVLLQMKPRQAGGILAEMPAERAAYLADSMALLTQKTAKGAGL
ncbi:hypothetical protein E1162_06720 [Rhodobacteraceae bacterium RKSG542]|uniref:MotE family protein n=1 Tax=Pseudovibrio flavus TaxID=2529854 RepID=UPI0012BC5793|nr:hypothetical protein [Pseudovibrio flavus]MTI16928.1 hypothetical protein [Pseudovibrio flavus]